MEVTSKQRGGMLLCLCAWLLVSMPAFGQDPLQMVDDNTTVRNVSFRFVDTRSFDRDRLTDRIATRGPSLFDRVQDAIPLLSSPPYRFSPLELQRDVERLRRFYERRGFPEASIDYPASQYDAESNTIHVIFTVNEGRPVIVQDVNFFGPDTTEYAVHQFDDEIQDEWINFRDRTAFRRGERYSEPEVTAMENDIVRWMRNSGYPFAELNSEVVMDTTFFTADLNFYLSPGHRARVSEILIEGNRAVSERVIRREIPLREGDWYHHDRLAEGQRELFGLNTFRVALFDLPEQERDTTVTVRFDIREGNLRHLSANTGYGRNIGLMGEGRWTHRNFLGAGRDFTVSGVANTGLLSSPQDRFLEERRFRGSLTLRQPYAGHRQLSAIVSPFVEFQTNPLLAISDQPFGINAREFGLTSTLLYEILPFRTASLQHTYARALRFTETIDETAAPEEQIQELRDLYDRSTVSLSAQLGRADDYVSPSEGFLVRPSVELAQRYFGSAIEYVRASNEVTGYLPLTGGLNFSARAHAGRLWPIGITRQQLRGERGTQEERARARGRFDLSRFYAGGSNDIRGWATQMAGDKRVRRIITTQAGIQDTTFVYEPEGGNIRLGYNLELRMPLPGVGSAWRSAVFFDAGHLGNELAVENFRYGAGAGIRYRTPVGHVRLDLAAKLNPDPQDMRNPADFYRDGVDADTDWWRRFRIHLSIGQSF